MTLIKYQHPLDMLLSRCDKITDPNIDAVVAYHRGEIELADVDDPVTFIIVLDYYMIELRYDKMWICRLFSNYEIEWCRQNPNRNLVKDKSLYERFVPFTVETHGRDRRTMMGNHNMIGIGIPMIIDQREYLHNLMWLIAGSATVRYTT